MDELFVGNNGFENNALYPVVITMQEDVLMYFEILGIPQITHTDGNIQSGLLLYLCGRMHKEDIHVPAESSADSWGF